MFEKTYENPAKHYQFRFANASYEELRRNPNLPEAINLAADASETIWANEPAVAPSRMLIEAINRYQKGKEAEDYLEDLGVKDLVDNLLETTESCFTDAYEAIENFLNPETGQNVPAPDFDTFRTEFQDRLAKQRGKDAPEPHVAAAASFEEVEVEDDDTPSSPTTPDFLLHPRG